MKKKGNILLGLMLLLAGLQLLHYSREQNLPPHFTTTIRHKASGKQLEAIQHLLITDTGSQQYRSLSASLGYPVSHLLADVDYCCVKMTAHSIIHDKAYLKHIFASHYFW